LIHALDIVYPMFATVFLFEYDVVYGLILRYRNQAHHTSNRSRYWRAKIHSEAESNAWLDTAVRVYGLHMGITLFTNGSGCAAGGFSASAAVNAEKFLTCQAEPDEIARHW
jgi:hypothetical protein